MWSRLCPFLMFLLLWSGLCLAQPVPKVRVHFEIHAVPEESLQTPLERLEEQLLAARKKRDWKQAIALTQKILEQYPTQAYPDAAQRFSDLGDFYLYQLDLVKARQMYERATKRQEEENRRAEKSLTKEDKEVRKELLSDRGWLRETTPEESVAEGMARLCAEEGDYREAIRWLAIWRQRPAGWCGLAIMGLAMEIDSHEIAWKAMFLPLDQARQTLKSLMADRDKPGRKTVGDYFPDRAAREAQLTLAELELRQGRRDVALWLFKTLMKGDDEAADLAAAHYEQALRGAANSPPVPAGNRSATQSKDNGRVMILLLLGGSGGLGFILIRLPFLMRMVTIPPAS